MLRFLIVFISMLSFSSSAFSGIGGESLKSCRGHYLQEWEQTQKVLLNLKNWGDNCWDSRQRQDIAHLKTKIQSGLEALSSALTGSALDQAQEQLRSLRENYQRVQNYLSYCRAHEILRPSSDIEALASLPFEKETFEDRLLIHILGDDFAKRTGLEGLDISESRHFDVRRIFLEKIQSDLLERTYIKDKRQADPCFDLPEVANDLKGLAPLEDFSQVDLKSMIAKELAAKKLTLAFFESMTAFLKTLKEQIDSRLLKEDDALYFQAGWVGHALVIEFRRQANELYTIRVYNSGDGLEFHSSLEYEQYLPFVEKINLSYEMLFNPLVLKSLRDLSVQRGEEDEKARSVNSIPEYLYLILEQWGGERVTREVALDDFLDPQKSGICGYYSIPYYHKSNAKNKKAADSLELFVRFQYLDFYMQKNRMRMQTVRSSYLIAEKSLSYFMQEVASLKPDDGTYIDAGVEVLAAEKSSLYSHILGQKSGSDLNPSPCGNQIESACSSSKDFPLVSYPDFVYPEIEESLVNIGISDLEGWDPKQETMIRDLENFSAEFSSDHYDQRIQFIKLFQDIALKLPLKHEFWDEFNQDDLKSILEILRRMSSQYLWSFFENYYASWTDTRGLTAVEYLAQVKILSVTDLIMSIFSKRDPFFEGEFPSLYQNLFDYYLYGSSISLTPKDFNWAVSLGEMRTYWEHRKNKGTSFFAFEKLPVRGGKAAERHFFNSITEYKNAQPHWSKSYGLPPYADWPDVHWVFNKIGKIPFDDFLKMDPGAVDRDDLMKAMDLLSEYKTYNWAEASKLSSEFIQKSGSQNELESASPEDMNLFSKAYKIPRHDLKFPQVFFHARAISFVSNYFLTGVFSRSIAKQILFDSETGVKNELNQANDGLEYFSYCQSGQCFSHYYLFHKQITRLSFDDVQSDRFIVLEDHEKSEGSPSEKEDILSMEDPSYQLGMGEEDQTLEKFKEALVERKNLEKGFIPLRLRESSNEALLKNMEQSKLSPEIFRKIIHLSGDKDLQILETAAFFREHPEYLQDKSYRFLFKKLMFDPMLLFNEFEKNDALPKILADFCKENYVLAKQNENYILALFFLRMNHLFLEHLETSRNRAQKKLFMDASDEYVSLLQSLDPALAQDHVIKNTLYRDWLRTYLKKSKFSSPLDLSYFLIAQLYRNLYPHLKSSESASEQFYEQDEENAIEGIFLVKQKLIQDYLEQESSHARNLAFNMFLQHFHPKMPSFDWGKNKCGMNSGDKSQQTSTHEVKWCVLDKNQKIIVSVDVLRAQILADGNKVFQVLPPSITEDEDFKQQVKMDANSMPIYFGGGVFEIIDQNGHQVRLKIADDAKKNHLIIQRKWQDQWFELASNSQLKNPNFRHLLPSYSNWISSSPLGIDPVLAQGNQKIPFEGWVGPKKDQAQVLIFEGSDLKAFSMIEKIGVQNSEVSPPSDEDPPYRIISVTLVLHNRLSPYILHNVMDPSSPYHWLKNFEDLRFVSVWTDRQTDRLHAIELPRFSLTFTPDVQKPERWISKEMEPFFLSPNQNLGEGKPSHHLVLERGDDKLVLLPLFMYKKKEKSLGDDVLDYQMNDFRKSRQRYLIYRINEGDQSLAPSDQESRFYLAYLAAWEHSYELSRLLLDDAGAVLGALSQQEKSLLLDIAYLQNKDHDPRVLVTQMLSWSILVSNHLFFHWAWDTQSRDPIKRLTETYNQYLSSSDQIAHIGLTKNQDISILKFLKGYIDESKFPLEYVTRLRELESEYRRWSRYLHKGRAEKHYPYISVLELSNSFREAAEKDAAYRIPNVFHGAKIAENFGDIYETILKIANPDTAQKDTRLSLLRTLKLIVPDYEMWDKCDDKDLKNYFISFLTLMSQTSKSPYSALAKLLHELSRSNFEDMKGLPDKDELMLVLKQAYSGSSRIQKWFQFLQNKETLSSGINHFEPNTVTISGVESSYASLSRSWKKNDNPNPVADVPYEVDIADPIFSDFMLKNPLLSFIDLENIIESSPQSDVLSLFQALISRFQRSSDDGFLKEKLKSVSVNLETYQGKVADEQKLRLKDMESLQSSAQVLQNKMSYLAESTKVYRKATEDLLAKIPDDLWIASLRQVKLSAGLERNLRFDQFLHAYASRDHGRIFRSNPSFKSEDVKSLVDQTTKYLLLSTYQRSVKNLLEKISYLQKSDPNDEEKLSEDLKIFKSLAEQVRVYDVAKHPDYLVFEYYSGFILRKDQIETLKIFGDENQKGSLLEMAMGAGKTSVILPLLSFQNTSDKKLNIVVMPEALIPSVALQLNQQLSKNFGRTVDLVQIRRQDKYSDDKLLTLKRRLLLDLNEQRTILISDSSVQSLFLMFVEKFYSFSEKSKEGIKIFRDIFGIFKKHAYVTIDEVDLILNVSKSHRFSMGREHRIEKDLTDAVFGLFRFLATDPGLRRLVSLPFHDRSSTENLVHVPTYSKEYYEKTIKPYLVDQMSSDTVHELLFDSSKTRNEYADLNKERLREFLRFSPVLSDTRDASDRLRKHTEYINSLPSLEMKNVVSAFYAEIHSILPLTLDKVHGVHYGLYPKLDQCKKKYCPEFISIPHDAGSPQLDSRFSSELEAMNYSLQTHLILKDSLPMLMKETSLLQDKYLKAVGLASKNYLEKRIRRFFPVVSIPDFMKWSASDVKSHSGYINKNPDLILELARSQLMSQLGVYEDQLVTNSYLYPTLFGNIQAMSGTVWNKESYPPFFQKDYLSDTQAKTLWLLWKNNREKIKVFKFSEKDTLRQKVDVLLDGYPASSIIDQGGVFKGYDHADVAKYISTHQIFRDSGLNQMIFYDKKHYLKVYDSEKDEISPLVDFKLNRLHAAAFWDLQHTTGSDLKVHPQTHAIVTLSRHSNLRDILQAVWRLRDLHINQRVSFALLEEDRNIILQTLQKDFGLSRENLRLDDLLFYLAANEAAHLSKLNHKSLRYAMKSELIKQSFDRLVDHNEPMESAHNLFVKVRSLFVESRPTEAHLRYGHPQVEADAAQALEQDAKNLNDSPIFEAFADEDEIKSRVREIASRGVKLVRKRLPFSLGFQAEYEGEMEVEAEQEQEQAQEEEQEDQIEAFTIDPNAVAFERVDWDKNLFFSGYYFEHSLQDKDLRTPHPLQVQKLPALLSLDRAFHTMREKDLVQVFDEQFFASLNLFPVFKSLENSENKHFSFFGEYQKDINDLLFVLDKKGQLKKCILIDREEALELGEWLLDETHDFKNDIALLYKFGLGVVRSSKNLASILAEKEERHEFFSRWIKSTDVRELIVQAKFLSARLAYDEDEKVLLKAWIERIGKEKMYYLFTKRILKKKAASQKEFEGSSIDQVFEELGY